MSKYGDKSKKFLVLISLGITQFQPENIPIKKYQANTFNFLTGPAPGYFQD
jgi:hypothetical protein